MKNTRIKSTGIKKMVGMPTFTPLYTTFLLLWIITTGVIIWTLQHDVRSTDQYYLIRIVLHISYVLSLLWYLRQKGQSLSQGSETRSTVSFHSKWYIWISVLVLILLFTLTIFSDYGIVLLIIFLIVACFWILLVWRKEILRRHVFQGFALALVAYLAGLQMVKNEFIETSVHYLLSGLSFPMYIAGGLIFQRTRLGGIQLFESKYLESLKSAIKGAMLFVPLGLLNAASGSSATEITWVTKWWMPTWLPWFSGIAEEVWFRLLLLGICFFILQPILKNRPTLLVILVVLFSGITFGLGHDRTLENFLTTGLLYGVPMAVVFVRRDFEHSVGAHYMVNMIPWIIVFLER